MMVITCGDVCPIEEVEVNPGMKRTSLTCAEQGAM